MTNKGSQFVNNRIMKDESLISIRSVIKKTQGRINRSHTLKRTCAVKVRLENISKRVSSEKMNK